MQKRIRQVDTKARTTLFPDFAGCTVMIERVGPEELCVRKVRSLKLVGCELALAPSGILRFPTTRPASIE